MKYLFNLSIFFMLILFVSYSGYSQPIHVNLKADMKFQHVQLKDIQLTNSLFQRRYHLNKEYVMSLRNDNLLQNFYFEAGMRGINLRNTSHGRPDSGDDMHWGWESPTCQLRGHFLGHWLSAAAYIIAETGDAEVKAKADYIVAELAKCQQQNGGEWIGSIPEKYLFLISEGKRVWAPHYTLHKTIMGLLDMAVLTDNRQALEIIENFAQWFHQWTEPFSREEMDDILDVETGGMLEVWSLLYGITGKEVHLDLVRKYERPRLFDRLLAGEDPLTNKHANTTIPEAHGAACAYEVTGNDRYRNITEAYWKSAVTDRGYYCTGGQTCAEVWSPPFELSSRLSEKTQEHCTVYNMIRLADYLFRWTGDVRYSDYIERNLYNGILAQQHPQTGMIAYWLPMEPGGKKIWGSPIYDFWCCHGTLVQAHTRYHQMIYYQGASGIVVSQYIPSTFTCETNSVPVSIRQQFNREGLNDHIIFEKDDAKQKPDRWVVDFSIECDKPIDFEVKFRVPWWVSGEASVFINDQRQKIKSSPSSFCSITKTWHHDHVCIILPKSITLCPLLGEPNTFAFMDGPVVLAGICSEKRTLFGNRNNANSMLKLSNEIQWGTWLSEYTTVNQDKNIRFIPLHQIEDENYTVYFPIRQK